MDGAGVAAPACGHDGPAVAPPVCAHLRAQRERWLRYYRYYVGRRLDHALLCDPCADAYDAGSPPEVAAVCAACLERAAEDVGELRAARGRPEVLERPEPLPAEPRAYVVGGLPAPLLDLAFAAGERRWYGLCAGGTVVRLAPGWAGAEVVARATLPPLPEPPPPRADSARYRLHVAASGRYAAVVVDYAGDGLVLDLATGARTMALHAEGTETFTVPFPLAFATYAGRDVLVHRTDWNRLDVADPATGAPLTGRPSPVYDRDDLPEHYLDYYHGRLYASPDGTYLLDDGWVWHPFGLPLVWRLDRWLAENVWESEDGPSLCELAWRDYYWDHGMCWLGPGRVAIEGIGEDDDYIVAGARVFDVAAPVAREGRRAAAREVLAFAGPEGAFFSDGERLFAAAPDGLSVWDPATGERTARVDGFVPTHHARETGELVALDGDRVVVLALVP